MLDRYLHGEELLDVVVLTVNVSADRDRSVDALDVSVDENLARFRAEIFDLRIFEYLAVHESRYPRVEFGGGAVKEEEEDEP